MSAVPAPTVPRTVCVIGAGPAGLVVARALDHRGVDVTIVERHSAIGGLWDIDNPGSPMYESAHFISSRTLSAFPGFPMPEDYPDYPSHRQILAYLRDFAEAYRLTERVVTGVEVTSVDEEDDGAWRVTRADGTSERFGAVVVCTGSQWTPRMPQLPGTFTGEVRHSSTYRDSSELAGRRVLVVGAGNSGCDIACDAARAADRASISLRRGYWFIPKHIFGKPVDVFADEGPSMPMWLEQRVFGRLLRMLMGDPAKLGLPRPEHRLFETHPILNDQLLHHLRHGDITARPGIATMRGTEVVYTDGTSEEVDLVLLATGFEHAVPLAGGRFGDEPHRDLYLGAFPREAKGLYGLGYVETNSGAYELFGHQAVLVAGHIADRFAGHPRAAWFTERVRTDRPDLTGGIRFVDSPRHAGYVNSPTLMAYLRKVIARVGWEADVAPQPPARRAVDGAPHSRDGARA